MFCGFPAAHHELPTSCLSAGQGRDSSDTKLDCAGSTQGSDAEWSHELVFDLVPRQPWQSPQPTPPSATNGSLSAATGQRSSSSTASRSPTPSGSASPGRDQMSLILTSWRHNLVARNKAPQGRPSDYLTSGSAPGSTGRSRPWSCSRMPGSRMPGRLSGTRSEPATYDANWSPSCLPRSHMY